MTSSEDRTARAVQEPKGTDPQWAEKIKLAKAAREQGKQLRAGRPATFSQRRSLAQG